MKMILLLIMLYTRCVIGDRFTGNTSEEHLNEKLPLFSDFLVKESGEIKNIEKQNEKLLKLKEILKTECDLKFKEYAAEFNRLLNEIRKYEGTPELHKMETRLQQLYVKVEIFDRARESFNAYINIFKLKQSTLFGDVQLLRSRQNKYQECQGYGTIIKFQPLEGEFGSRSLGSAKADILEGQEDIATLLYERSKILLDVKKQQATFKGLELKNFIAYYSGYCERRINNIKNITDKLRKYPKGIYSLIELKKEVARLVHGLEFKISELNKMKKDLSILIPRILDLQKEYDSMNEPANCFLKLSQWHIDQSVNKIDELSKKVETFITAETVEMTNKNRETVVPFDLESAAAKTSSEINNNFNKLSEADGETAGRNNVETGPTLSSITADFDQDDSESNTAKTEVE